MSHGQERLQSSASTPDEYADTAVLTEYAALRTAGLFEREQRIAEEYFDPDSTLLDIGCGAGRTTAALAEAGYGVIGLDRSVPMVRSAAAALPAVPVVAGDATALPFPDGTFDQALFSYNGLDEISPEGAREAALSEAARVLEPGGVFAFSSRNARRRWLPVPPTPSHVQSLARHWVGNALEGRLGSAYKRDHEASPSMVVHFTTPRKQCRQLRRCGFEPVAVLGRGGLASRLFGPTLYYVARKRRDSAPTNEPPGRP